MKYLLSIFIILSLVTWDSDYVAALKNSKATMIYCEIFNDDEVLADISSTNIICNKNNTIDQNLEAQYGDIRHIVQSAKLGIGMETSKNFQTFCNAIGNTLDNLNTDELRKLLYLSGKGLYNIEIKAGGIKDLTLDDAIMIVTGRLYNYSHTPGLQEGQRHRYPQYAFVTLYLDLIQTKKADIPADFKSLLAAFLRADLKQVKKVIQSVPDKKITEIKKSCKDLTSVFYRPRDDCYAMADKVKETKEFKTAIGVCEKAGNHYMFKNNDISLDIFVKAHEILNKSDIEENHFYYLKAVLTERIGVLYEKERETTQALDYFKKSLDFLSKTDNTIPYIEALINYRIGHIYKNQALDPKGSRSYELCYKAKSHLEKAETLLVNCEDCKGKAGKALLDDIRHDMLSVEIEIFQKKAVQEDQDHRDQKQKTKSIKDK